MPDNKPWFDSKPKYTPKGKPKPAGGETVLDVLDKAVDDAIRDVFGAAVVTKKKAEEVVGLYEKWKDRLDALLGIIDPEKRSVTLFDLGASWALDKLSDLLDGAKLDKHPYWMLHKAHFEVFKELLKADAQKVAAGALYAKAEAAADKLVSNTAGFLDKYAVGGELWKKYARLSDEEKIDAEKIAASFKSNREPEKWRKYRLYYTMRSRRAVVTDLTGGYGLLGADRTQMHIALQAYRKKYTAMIAEGRLSGVAGATERKDDLTRQANAFARQTHGTGREKAAINYTPEEKARDANKAAYDLTRQWMVQIDKLNEMIRQTK